MSSPLPNSRLRPLHAGDIIDEAISLYRDNFLLFIIIGAIAQVPVAVAQLIFAVVRDDTAGAEPRLSAGLGIAGLIGLAGIVLTLLAMAATMWAASEAWFGRRPTPGEVWRRAAGLGPRLILLALLMSVLLLLIAVTIIGFPVAIYLGTAWVFGFPILVVEGIGGYSALRRSRALIRGNWWRVLGIFILIAIILGVISFVFSIPATAVEGGSLLRPDSSPSTLALVVRTLASATGEILTRPIAYCSWMLLYFDLRIRNEGLDLQLATAEIEQGMASAASLPQGSPAGLGD